jgi:hypothetical protein
VWRAVVLVVVVAWAGPALAQSPRAGGPSPGEDPTPRLAVDLGVAGNLARGFVDRDLVTARGVVEASRGPWSLYTQPYWLYGRVGTPMGKLTTDNEIYDRTGLFRQLRGRFFAYAVNAYDRSLRRKIEHRDLLGVGAGATVWHCGPSSLLTSYGLLYEWADFDDHLPLVDADDQSLGAPDGARHRSRFSGRLYGRYKLRTISLIHDLIVIPSFHDPLGDYRVIFYGAVDAPIGYGFSFRVQADATQEGVIVAGTKHGDLAVTFGVGFKHAWKRAKPAAQPSTP